VFNCVDVNANESRQRYIGDVSIPEWLAASKRVAITSAGISAAW
jgi:hypothetical protein